MEVYKNKLIAYSLENFLTYGVFNIKGPNGISVILKADIEAQSGNFAGGRLIPVKILNKGIPEVDNDKEAVTLIKKLIQEDMGISRLNISDNGELNLIN